MRQGADINFSTDAYNRAFTQPQFAENSKEIAKFLSQMDSVDLMQQLKVNIDIAELTQQRYQKFGSLDAMLTPALLAYNGIVFKHIAPQGFDKGDMLYAQSHLLITSFLYGFLRPLDIIEPYRVEGAVKINIKEYNGTIFGYWRDKLTDALIDRVKENGGILCNLASAEMKGLFNWTKVCKEIKVVTPQFYVRRGDKLKTIVVYTKIARGEMVNYIIKNQITNPSKLCEFERIGYQFIGEDSNDLRFVLSEVD